MKTYRERSRCKVRVVFEDEDRVPFIPTTIRYRLDDRTNDCTTQLVDWTAVAPQSSIEITISSDANRILNSCNAYETRILTIQSDYDTPNQLSEELPYLVQNMRGFN